MTLRSWENLIGRNKTHVFCFKLVKSIIQSAFSSMLSLEAKLFIDTLANNVDPDQTAP